MRIGGCMYSDELNATHENVSTMSIKDFTDFMKSQIQSIILKCLKKHNSQYLIKYLLINYVNGARGSQINVLFLTYERHTPIFGDNAETLRISKQILREVENMINEDWWKYEQS